MKSIKQIPQDYKTKLDFFQTQKAISLVKRSFESELSTRLKLQEVAAPRIVSTDRGLQDDLAGTQEAVSFKPFCLDKKVEIVHSLAKWKRFTLGKYGFKQHTGLLTIMDAIRKDEEVSPIHSLYVDQWDWEVVISKEDRSKEFLKDFVRDIYESILQTEKIVCEIFSSIKPQLRKTISFITTSDLEKMYPSLSSKDREHAIAKELGSVFIMEIGDKLLSGEPHDLRAADYDDWSLDGDIIIWDSTRDSSIEISSMGIRVDKETLLKQLKKAKLESYAKLEFHKGILENKLPLSIGGGIGRSRLCMLLLQKAHIGEVQSCMWPKEILEECSLSEVELL